MSLLYHWRVHFLSVVPNRWVTRLRREHPGSEGDEIDSVVRTVCTKADRRSRRDMKSTSTDKK